MPTLQRQYANHLLGQNNGAQQVPGIPPSPLADLEFSRKPNAVVLQQRNVLAVHIDLEKLNKELEPMTAEQRIQVLLRYFPDAVVTSSFGAKAAVMLHLASRIKSDIPILFIDTQYHFPETLGYVDELKYKLKLNVHTYRNPLSAHDQELKFGKLWEQGDEGAKTYGYLNKTVPLSIGLEELGANAWITGVMREQSETRSTAKLIELEDGRLKLQPLADWTEEQVNGYMLKNKLLYHPLWYEGFKRIGDRHTTQYPDDWQGGREESFSHRECGLHTRFAEIERNGSGI